MRSMKDVIKSNPRDHCSLLRAIGSAAWSSTLMRACSFSVLGRGFFIDAIE